MGVLKQSGKEVKRMILQTIWSGGATPQMRPHPGQDAKLSTINKEVG